MADTTPTGIKEVIDAIRAHGFDRKEVVQQTLDALIQKTRQIGTENYGLDPAGFHNGPLDAFRHALAGAWVAREIGVEYARAMGVANEINSPNEYETDMDEWNNEVGFSIADVASDLQEVGVFGIDPTTRVNDFLADAVADAVKRGITINSPARTGTVDLYTQAIFRKSALDFAVKAGLIDESGVPTPQGWKSYTDDLIAAGYTAFETTRIVAARKEEAAAHPVDMHDYSNDLRDNHSAAKIADLANAGAINRTMDRDHQMSASDRQHEMDRQRQRDVGDQSRRPIILDLDGNGVQIAQLSQSNQFFDTAGDGYQHRTAWAGNGDAVLAFDSQNDGKIDQKQEIVFTEWDPTAKSDMQALRDVFDVNQDGKLDASDIDSKGNSIFSQPKVMVTNADGTTTAQTLTAAGVTSIKLIENAVEIALPDGSTITGQTTFTKSGGGTGTAKKSPAQEAGRGGLQTKYMSCIGSYVHVGSESACSLETDWKSPRGYSSAPLIQSCRSVVESVRWAKDEDCLLSFRPMQNLGIVVECDD